VSRAFGNQGEYHQAKFAMIEQAARPAPMPMTAVPMFAAFVFAVFAIAVFVTEIAIVERSAAQVPAAMLVL
jgi:hypothetical protein